MTTATVHSRLITRPLLLRSGSILGASVGFFLPLSVVPMLAGSGRGAGLATVALLLATVVGEVATPRLVSRIGYRAALALGLILLGAPTIVLAVSAKPAVVLAVCVLRGLGFAICTVAGGALTAKLIPPDRRGQGLAFVGLVSGVSSLLALPAGVWAAHRWGFGPVFVTTALITLLALLSVPGLPRRSTSAESSPAWHNALARPAVIFAASTSAVGVFVTFLPLAGHQGVVATALLVQPAAATAARWVAGRLGDRYGHRRLLVPGLVLVAVGTAGLAVAAVPSAVLFGVGFGLLQNATLALMYDSLPPGGEDTVSATWNIAYDLGMAAGALVGGLLVGPFGVELVFVLAAVATLPALALIPRRN
ncbi:MFS transporter [Actinoplanes sp. TRM 88003]|uniref:MFS transporter n=1 Tax=Paractinoplanes aksuensis TaxID=2939490 RepID=A0ABT1DES5_9ACTN|nr:MFS transporter [Actinoplanes aksuensis]MCO8269315.1 MFS transporter [Actinoplanes aksuensis]